MTSIVRIEKIEKKEKKEKQEKKGKCWNRNKSMKNYLLRSFDLVTVTVSGRCPAAESTNTLSQ